MTKNEYNRAYKETHREELRYKKAIYAKAHPRKREQTPEKIKYDHEYSIAHREERNEYHRMYRLKYPEKQQRWGQAAFMRRQALKRGSISTVTAEQIQAIKSVYESRCAYCGVLSQALAMDHIIPLSHGGEDIIGNLVPACQGCNSSKGDGPPPSIPTVRLLL